MADTIDVTVVTPEKAVARGKAEMVVAPSVMGEVGILPDHRALLADLGIGVVELRRGSAVERYAVSGGFLEVSDNQVTLLAETAERHDEIDVERSRESLRDSEGRLKVLEPLSDQYAEQDARARRALNRLNVVNLP